MPDDRSAMAMPYATVPWLSGLAGHTLKHQLEVPLLVTFHTLDRVKADASPEELSAAEPARRAHAEAEIVGCADAVLASCSVEAEQLIELYGAEPARIEIVPLGVEHAFTLKIHVIDERVAALRSARDAIELLLNLASLGGGGCREHFR